MFKSTMRLNAEDYREKKSASMKRDGYDPRNSHIDDEDTVEWKMPPIETRYMPVEYNDEYWSSVWGIPEKKETRNE